MDWLIPTLSIVGGIYVLGFLITLFALVVHLINWAKPENPGGPSQPILPHVPLVFYYSLIWMWVVYVLIREKLER